MENGKEPSWEELRADYMANRNRKESSQSEALSHLKAIIRNPSAGYGLSAAQAQEIQNILDHRLNCMQNLVGVIEEYVAMPCESLRTRMQQTATRCSKAVP
jgi:hypothetical protein